MPHYRFYASKTERVLATTVTVKGQVTLPKAVREASGIRPGDRVEVRGVVIGRAERSDDADAYLRVLQDISRRRPIKGATTEEIMAMTRDDQGRRLTFADTNLKAPLTRDVRRYRTYSPELSLLAPEGP